jgi:hypothetical protein
MEVVIEGTSGELGRVKLHEATGIAIPDEGALRFLEDTEVRDPDDPEMELFFTDGRRYLRALVVAVRGDYCWARLVEEGQPF